MFKYYNDDGSPRLELRPPEEVFKKDSLKTFAGKPITNDHPKEFCGPDNVDELQVGSTVNELEVADNGHVRIKGNIHSQDGVQAAENGKNNYSGGYKADIIFDSGTWTNPFTGEVEKFDAIQRNIRGNHVALVNHPRGGDKCGFRFDGRQSVYKRSDGVVNHPSNSTPIAPLDTDWSGSDARQDLRENTDASPDSPTDEFDSGFMWVPEDSDNLSDRKYPFKKEVDGQLAIIPRAVFAIVSNLRGGGQPSQIPEDDKAEIWAQCRDLYERFRNNFDDFDETLPESRSDSIIVPSSFTPSSRESSYIGAVLGRSTEDSDKSALTDLTGGDIQSIIDSDDEEFQERLDELSEELGLNKRVIESACILDRWETGGEMPNIKEVKDSEDESSFQVEVGNKIYDSLTPELAEELESSFEKLDELEGEKEDLEAKLSSLEAERDKLKADSEDEESEEDSPELTEQEKIDYAEERVKVKKVADSVGVDSEKFDDRPSNEQLKKAAVEERLNPDRELDLDCRQDMAYVNAGFDQIKGDVDDKTPADNLTGVQHGDGKVEDDEEDSGLSKAEKKRREYQNKL